MIRWFMQCGRCLVAMLLQDDLSFRCPHCGMVIPQESKRFGLSLGLKYKGTYYDHRRQDNR